uniref:hypothetical protein n=1 Tax=Candidatus Limisoma sp. TaxID=3076476 RepID=UPI00402526B2
MNWFEVIIFSLQLILVGCVFLYKKSLEEFAKVLYARELEYKKEKGKYDALNDSLQTILKEFEQMKSAVSLEEQRRHNWIESRNQKLINLIRYSEIINIGKARLMTALDNESKSELEKLQADINSTIVNLRVDSLTLMGVNPEINDHSVTEFTDAVFLLGNEVLVRISNARSLLESYEKMLSHALTLPDGQEKLNWMQKALDNKKDLIEMKNNTTYNSHIGYEDKETQYLIYLRNIFGKGIVLKADIDSCQE